MTDRRSTVETFTINRATFTCWITADGAGQRYEWRSACGRYAVWRVGREVLARAGNRLLRCGAVGLSTAMSHITSIDERRAA